MRRLLIPFLASAVFLGAYGETQIVEKRDSVTYRSGEWSGRDSRHSVDVQPQPVGGMAAFLARLDYPADLRRQGITGTMRVQISLDAAGRLLSAQVIQSVHPTLDAIVLRALRETQWKPAMKNGKAIPWRSSFPVAFKRGA